MIKQLLTSRGRAAADLVYQTNPKPPLELPYLKAHRRLGDSRRCAAAEKLPDQ